MGAAILECSEFRVVMSAIVAGWSERIGAEAAIDAVTKAPRAAVFSANLCKRFNLNFGPPSSDFVLINYKKTKHLF